MVSTRQRVQLSALAVVALLVIACRSEEPPAGSQTTGGRLYAVNCSTCHGPSGHGVGDAPKIVGTTDILGGDYDRTVIAEGRNLMPGFGVTLSQAEIDEIVDYVATFKD